MARQVNFNGYLLRQFGAYIRTDLSALVEVSGVASGIIGITGLAERGPTNTPVTVTSYIQLVNIFGDGPLVRHGLAAYVGGANTLIAVRLNDSESAFAAQTAEFNVVVNSTDGYTFRALEPGTYGNSVSVRVSTPVIGGTIVASSDTVISDAIEYFNVPIPEDVADETDFTPGSYMVVENWNTRFGSEGYDPSSYAVFRWNGDRWSIAQTRDINSLVTTRIGSTEETIQVPYYIEETPMIRALGLGTPGSEGRYYYVLLNVENNQVRPVPENWLAGAIGDGVISFEDFERIVNNLKGDDEILFNGTNPADFEIFLNAPKLFPFQLVKHIINFGGFGSGPSSVVSIDDADSAVVNPPLVSQGFTFLQGGYNGEDGTGWASTAESEAGNFTSSPSYPTTAWDVALGVFENEEVNFIQPAYLFGSNAGFEPKYAFFKSIAQKFITHVNLMSNTPNRKFRTTILGIPSGQDGVTSLNATQYLARTQDVTGVINSDRVQLWAGGFFSSRFSGPTQRNVLYGAEWLASFVSGAHASRDVSVSLTFSQISQIITGGTEYM